MKVFVTSRELCVHSEYSDEDYGDWSESLDCSVTRVSLQRHRGRSVEEFELGDTELSVGDLVWVLTMTYETGDSFGRRDGNQEVLWVFQDEHQAELARRAVRNQEEELTLVLQTQRGEVKLSNPGYGYFEHINNVDVETHIVEE